MPTSTNPCIRESGYEDAFRALGAEIDRLHLAEVVVVELEQGLLLKGQSIIVGHSQLLLEPRSGFIANGALEELIAAAREQRVARHRWPWERA